MDLKNRVIRFWEESAVAICVEGITRREWDESH